MTKVLRHEIGGTVEGLINKWGAKPVDLQGLHRQVVQIHPVEKVEIKHR